jgi:cyclic pyranopterin phosphate synthase
MLNHFDEKGSAVMVDVSHKQPTMRTAVASAAVVLKPEILAAIIDGRMSKGDVLGVARLAGIAAAKKTSDLIPLSHPLAIHHAAIDFSIDRDSGTVKSVATVKSFERTGVEMEAMIAATISALTIYDMCKGTDKSIYLEKVELLSKEGGKSGTWTREKN